jgi:hypothetical protein
VSTIDLHPPRDQASNGGLAAVVAVGAETLEQEIEVVIPVFSTDQRFGPCRWQSRQAGEPLPSRGDPCLVVMDETQTPWVVTYWPYP